ncbi:MAG: hypothetical protein F4011_10115 [Acidimicrobiaceae bacterium]|nr:hypothetical protein [Acidimicrobiaceae bacterium]MYL04520.1 hypothetical protein [Acidimicrobiaceae bacterium]
METEVLATLLGVALAALVAACGAGFRWMRSEFNGRFDGLEGRVDRLETKIDRLEAKVDSLIMALARSGLLVDYPSAEPSLPPPDPPTLEAGGGGAVA